jgi:hypothetical protein
LQETEYFPFGLAIPRTAGTNKLIFGCAILSAGHDAKTSKTPFKRFKRGFCAFRAYQKMQKFPMFFDANRGKLHDEKLRTKRHLTE